MPAAFCAAALLLSREWTVRSGGAVWWIVLALFVVPVGLGFQRLPFMLSKFGGQLHATYTRFGFSDTERLAAAVGSSGVMVDTEGVLAKPIPSAGIRASPHSVSALGAVLAQSHGIPPVAATSL